MNTLESSIVASPFGVAEECAKFIVDDTTQLFVLSDIAVVGQQYTFTCWVKTDEAGVLNAEGESLGCSDEWSKFEVSFTASSVDFMLIFGVVGTYYIYHPQLEIGTIPSDYTLAPEDVEKSIDTVADETRTLINEQSTSIREDSEAIVMSALESYVSLEEYGEFKQTVETEFSVRAGEIDMKFSDISAAMDSMDEETRTKFEEFYKHITFSTNGITVSAGSNAMSIRIDNDIVVFEKDGVHFGWWDGVDFHTGNIMVEVTERAQFGNFAYIPRSDGSLSFLKVEHKTGFYASANGGILSIYGAYPTLEDTTMVISDITATISETTLILGGE